VTAFTPEQRAELRASIDRSKREARAEPRKRKATRPPKSPVVRAAEHAQRASEAKDLARDIVGVPRPPLGHCQFCGAPAKHDVCHAHADLLEGN
jgi:hypothetical protein